MNCFRHSISKALNPKLQLDIKNMQETTIEDMALNRNIVYIMTHQTEILINDRFSSYT